MKKYIAHKRFKSIGIELNFNIPYGTDLIEVENYICTLNGNIICLATSQNAYDYFARNDDGNGLERGKLIQEIKKVLSKKDSGYQDRWDKVWEDEVCLKYKRVEYADYFIWNHEFHNAPIKDLQYIANLVGASH